MCVCLVGEVSNAQLNVHCAPGYGSNSNNDNDNNSRRKAGARSQPARNKTSSNSEGAWSLMSSAGAVER